MRLADLASILAQGCTLWTDSFKLSGTPARSGGFRFYKKGESALTNAFAFLFYFDLRRPIHAEPIRDQRDELAVSRFPIVQIG